MTIDALALSGEDNVATALRPLEAGHICLVQGPDATLRIEVGEAIPFGHKLATQYLPAGTVIRKYGEAIGAARFAIAAGTHVHTHNLTSLRARG